MPVQTFRDDDAGYEAWLIAHPTGWVVNARRSPSPTYLKLHRAECATISQLQAGYSRWTTGEYIKVCGERRDELDAWAQRTFSADLQERCHSVQYASRARISVAPRAAVRRRSVALASAAAPVALDPNGYWVIETSGLIPFEPTDGTLLASRAALRSMLAGLSAARGELLHEIVEGPAVAGTDLDNALLYNVGGSIDGAARYGVVLERRTAAQEVGTRYRYGLTSDVDVPGMHGEPVAELVGVRLARAPRAWPDIWAAVRVSDAVRVLASAPAGALGMRLRVGAPGFAGAANSQFVKTILDGVVTALHAHGDRSTAADVGDRLAATIALTAGEIAALLVDPQRAALGVRQRLVVQRGHGVQCQPQDGRISALHIEIDRSARAWGLSGQLVRMS